MTTRCVAYDVTFWSHTVIERLSEAEYGAESDGMSDARSGKGAVIGIRAAFKGEGLAGFNPLLPEMLEHFLT